MPAYVRPIWNRDNPPLRLRADAVNNWLKLRHNFAPPKSNGQLRMEIGLDVDIKNAKARPLPWLAFLYTVPVAVCSGLGSGKGKGEGGRKNDKSLARLAPEHQFQNCSSRSRRAG